MGDCRCKECVGMCKRYPCWPLPKEAKELILRGFGEKLMLDNFEGKWEILCPAMKGYEGKRIPNSAGIIPNCCTFLTNDLCDLHDLGLKPLEGREISCKSSLEERGVHTKIAMEWITKEGEEVVTLWKERFYKG